MTQHTPGPWHYHDGRKNGTRQMVGTGEMWIAEMTTGIGFDQSDTEAEANARLFAAAPDLLEAGRVAVDLWDSTSAAVDPDEILMLIRDAIAKATEGESQ